jgi:hypothetical protein
MFKKCFRPFWSYDVQETEKWLAQMAGQGWHLVSVDFVLRVFRFVKGEPKSQTYCFEYGKFQDSSLPSGLEADGWAILSFSAH